ncbi:hypothetical protein [Microcella sp.]|uniref:hypothetical protein n=1 Tax=Microcella sp. TaxID=1913979 RepID=UPI002566A3D9|nr:hypothetical protein [Microcella sp.]MBX9472210.1 hypothetical protein [Microcella sp.]
MNDERDPGADAPETGGFDADEWFRTQFASPPTSPPPPSSAPIALPPPSAGSAPAPDPGRLLPPPLMPPPPAATPVPFEPSATEPMQVVPEPTVALPAADQPATDQPTADQPATDQLGRPAGDAATELMRTPEEGGALDELFGSEKFTEFDEQLIPAAPRRVAATDGGEKPPRAPLTKNQKVLLWIAGSLVALLALVALFFVGTRIPDLLGPAPGAEPSPTPTPTPTPTETERPIGPVPPGDYWWDELWGGECLEPFENAWQDQYTVIDCGEVHGGQLVARLPFPLPEGATEQGPYPGDEVLAAQIAILCSAPGVIDLAAASVYTDVQLQGAFAVTEEQWDEGQQDYFCFVSRSSGEPLTRSLAVPPAPPAG